MATSRIGADPWTRPAYEAVFRRCGVGPQTILLDVGCGSGDGAVLAIAAGALVSGIDPSPAAIAAAEARAPGASFHVGELEKFPYPDDTFDVVISFNSFSAAGDPHHALREARRVVKRGGRVALAISGEDHPFFPDGAAEALLERAGLRPVEHGHVHCPMPPGDSGTVVRYVIAAA